MGMVVAIVHVDSGKVIATAKIDKINDREVRTDTPYEQLVNRERELSRRYWRGADPHTEMRVPRDEKAARAHCVIRPATGSDIAMANRRVEVRRAKERMPRSLRDKDEHERLIRIAEEQLQRQRDPYERLLEQIRKDEALIASDNN